MKGDVGLHIMIGPKLLEKLRAKAKRERVTITGLLRVMIARELEKK